MTAFHSVLVYALVQTATSRYLSLSQAFYPLGAPALPPRRSPLVLRLFALALADGSGLPPRCIRHRRRSKAKPLRGSRGGFCRRAQDLQKREPQLSPPLAGCPHPSRRGVTPHRATFPKGKAKAALESQTFGTHQTCTAVHLCTEKPPD